MKYIFSSEIFVLPLCFSRPRRDRIVRYPEEKKWTQGDVRKYVWDGPLLILHVTAIVAGIRRLRVSISTNENTKNNRYCGVSARVTAIRPYVFYAKRASVDAHAHPTQDD